MNLGIFCPIFFVTDFNPCEFSIFTGVFDTWAFFKFYKREIVAIFDFQPVKV